MSKEEKNSLSKQALSKQKLAKHDRAIHEYLESLLLEVDDEKNSAVIDVSTEKADVVETVRTHQEPEKTPPVLGLEQLVAEVPDVIVETISEIKTQEETEVEVATELKVQVETPLADEAGEEVPEWGQADFQCLLFKVSGLSLAVPLVKLNSVMPWDENITQTPNQTEWYLGLVKHFEHQVKVIDTALLVMPENRREKIEMDAEKRLSHILLVDNYKWGLACDSIGDVIWLNTNDVKWRKNKTSRAWLSGTSLEHLCAIMDTEVFAEMLTQTK